MVRQENTRNDCTIVHFLVGVMLRQYVRLMSYTKKAIEFNFKVTYF